MDKSFAKKVISVVLGIALILLIFSTVTLIIDTVLLDDLKYFNGTDFDNLQKFFKWSGTGLICLIIPTVASYVFAYFSNRKIMTLIACVFSFITAISCFVLFGACRVYALEGFSSTNYASASLYFNKFIQIAISVILLGAYFLTDLLRKTPKAETENKDAEEIKNEEN